MTIDKEKSFSLHADKCDLADKTAFRLTSELLERIVEAENIAFKNEIEANAVVVNGRKYGMLKGHPGLTPAVFGMKIETRIDMPDDCDFFLQERPPKPKTNGDKIRSMSDYKLAKWMASIASCMRCPVDLSTCQSMYEDKNGECDKILLDWLKSQAEVDDG